MTKQFCFEVPVEVMVEVEGHLPFEVTVMVKVEGAANEQEAREEAEDYAKQYASEKRREYASEKLNGKIYTIRLPDAEFTKKLKETFLSHC